MSVTLLSKVHPLWATGGATVALIDSQRAIQKGNVWLHHAQNHCKHVLLPVNTDPIDVCSRTSSVTSAAGCDVAVLRHPETVNGTAFRLRGGHPARHRMLGIMLDKPVRYLCEYAQVYETGRRGCP
eukprot:scaffold108_cov514-Pavlova_lutheri.AAC.2